MSNWLPTLNPETAPFFIPAIAIGVLSSIIAAFVINVFSKKPIAVQFVYLLSVGAFLWAVTNFGLIKLWNHWGISPPYVFVVSDESAETTGPVRRFDVLVSYVAGQQPGTSSPAKLQTTHGDHLYFVPAHDTMTAELENRDSLSIASIHELEFKGRRTIDGHSYVLWACIPSGGGAGANASLILCDEYEFRIFDEEEETEIFPRNFEVPFNAMVVRVQENVSLNDMLFIAVNNVNILLLLGYDGQLYVVDKPFEPGTYKYGNPGIDGSKPRPVTLSPWFSLGDAIAEWYRELGEAKVDSLYWRLGEVESGWQTICIADTEIVGGGEIARAKASLGDGKILYFMATNADEKATVLFALKEDDIVQPSVSPEMALLTTPEDLKKLDNCARWLEGKASLVLGDKSYICGLDAGYDHIFFYQSKNDRIAKNIDPERIGSDSDPRYVEGIAVLCDDKKRQLVVSDRTGTLHFTKYLDNTDLGNKKIKWMRTDLPGGVRHGQGICYDSQENGIWLAAEDHFRFISKRLLTEEYDAANKISNTIFWWIIPAAALFLVSKSYRKS